MPIQDNGDIRLHGQEGIVVVFEFTDNLGAPRVMTGATVLFKTETYSKALTAGIATNQMVLTIGPTDLPDVLLNKKTPYIILDNTTPAVPQVILTADVVVTGWN